MTEGARHPPVGPADHVASREHTGHDVRSSTSAITNPRRSTSTWSRNGCGTRIPGDLDHQPASRDGPPLHPWPGGPEPPPPGGRRPAATRLPTPAGRRCASRPGVERRCRASRSGAPIGGRGSPRTQRSQHQGVERGAVAAADDHDRAAREAVRVAFEVIGDISAEGAVGSSREVLAGGSRWRSERPAAEAPVASLHPSLRESGRRDRMAEHAGRGAPPHAAARPGGPARRVGARGHVADAVRDLGQLAAKAAPASSSTVSSWMSAHSSAALTPAVRHRRRPRRLAARSRYAILIHTMGGGM